MADGTAADDAEGSPDESYTFDEGPIRPGVRVDSYLVEAKLGSGGMGSVFAARHVGLDKPVVLKALHRVFAARPESVMRFVREGRAASKIRHPHVVDVTDVGTHEGIPFLVMEYLEGEDLERRMDAVGAMSATEIVEIMLPVLDAVATAHASGVVHRDLKPSNIFLAVGPHGRRIPKVLDFGIAKILDTEGVDRVTLTRSASFIGTPYYASPEQAKSGREADARSDQYSLGAILYQLASGRLPVEGRTPFEVLGAIVAREAKSFQSLALPHLRELGVVIDRAMAYEPRDRFPDVRALGAALLPLATAEVRTVWRQAFGVPEVSGARSTDDFVFAATMAPGTLEPVNPAPPARAVGTPIPPTATPGQLAAVSAPAFTPPASSHPPPSIETAAVAPARKGRGPLFAIAIVALVLVLGGAGAAGIVVLGGPRPSPPAPPVDAPPPPIAITVSPADARIELDGVHLGVGTAEIPRDGRAHRLRLSAPGHLPREVRIDAEAETTLEPFTLEPEPPPVVEDPPPIDPPVEAADPPDPPPVEAPVVATPEPPAPVAPEPRGRRARRDPAPYGGTRRSGFGTPLGGAPYGGSPSRFGGSSPSPTPRLGRNNAPVLR